MEKFFKKMVASAALLTVASVGSQVQAYDADVNIGPDFNNTLFSQGTTPAPLDTIVWFVASTDANLGTFGANTTLTPDQLLGPDDTLISQRKVDGAAGAYGAGYLVDIVSGIDAANAPRNIFVILFGNETAAGSPNLTPDGGETFGFAALGVRTVPGFGNADWSPLGSIVGNTHLIVIPEPSTYLLGGLGLLALVGYRRFRK
jgi:hypothetical protein